jgi:hypothetical protein
MRRVTLAAAVALGLLLVASGRADAHPWTHRNIGIGVVLGQPTGLTLDIRPTHWSSFEIDVGLGDFDEDESSYAHLTYQVRVFQLTHKAKLAVPFYLGVGAYAADGHGRDFDDDAVIGVRAPIGIAFEFRAPVQIFLEVALMFDLVQIGFDANDRTHFRGAVGFRLYF